LKIKFYFGDHTLVRTCLFYAAEMLPYFFQLRGLKIGHLALVVNHAVRMPGRLGAPEKAAADIDGRDRCCCPRHLVGTGAEDSTRDLRIVSC
jgi:hypothetical protein